MWGERNLQCLQKITSNIQGKYKETPVCYMQIIKASKVRFSILSLGFVALGWV